MEESEYLNICDLEDKHWWYLSTHRAAMKELASFPPHAEVLDAGCGTGGFLNSLKKQYKLTGFDVSHEALRGACRKANWAGLLVQGHIEEIPCKPAQFHAVTCLDVIYHTGVSNETRALREVHRVLRPGGYLVLQVPAFKCLRGGHDEVVHARRRYRKNEIRSILDQSGFQVTRIFYRYPWLFLPALIVRHFTRGSGKSDLKPVKPMVNSLLLSVSGFFDSPILHLLPFGTSLFAVARKG